MYFRLGQAQKYVAWKVYGPRLAPFYGLVQWIVPYDPMWHLIAMMQQNLWLKFERERETETFKLSEVNIGAITCR